MKLTRFALVADTHITCGAGDKAALYQQRLARAVAAINKERVDFVLHAGDLTDNGSAEDFAMAQKLLQPLQAPLMLVGGNHDFGGKLVTGRNDQVTA
ncbi:MAG: metallophosphoesterase, partial [Verrucomicrobiae bacterium]|nr:metallophosphoesterase [Verrucomicrobiae bacterium]